MQSLKDFRLALNLFQMSRTIEFSKRRGKDRRPRKKRLNTLKEIAGATPAFVAGSAAEHVIVGRLASGSWKFGGKSALIGAGVGTGLSLSYGGAKYLLKRRRTRNR